MDENLSQSKSNLIKSSKLKSFIEIAIVIILAIVIAILINTFLITSTRVHGISMENTLYGGENTHDNTNKTFFNSIFFGSQDNDFLGDKVMLLKTDNVKQGDIVVFKAYDESNNPIYEYDSNGNATQEQWIKRVIGIAGDEIYIANGKVYVNDELLDEPYIKEQNSTIITLFGTMSITVKEGEIFVLGDNRKNSTDSRRVGCIKLDQIVGRVILVFGKESQTIKTPKKISNLIISIN